MAFLKQVIRHPQQLWIRRLNFQIHLWAGVILASYLIVIGLTGSVLVFGLELGKLLDPDPWPGISLQQQTADIAKVIETLRLSYPHTHLVSVMAPNAIDPVFIAILQAQKRTIVACHPVTGQLLGEVPNRHSRLDWVYGLHEDLLARRTGRVVNGICAASLLLLATTGLINWWLGIRQWTRGLKVDFRRRWRRVNFDLHSAIGFWSFSFLVVWSTTGSYFVWPDKYLSFVNHFSPIVNSLPPAVTVDPETGIIPLDFHSMLINAYSVDPGTKWKGIIFPSSRSSPFEMLLSRSPGHGRDYEDTVYFNPYNGQYITLWQYGVNKTLGDWVIWLQIPVHFGTHWGLAIKCLWALVGLGLPALAVTGLLMYWNRVLSKRWQMLKRNKVRTGAQ